LRHEDETGDVPHADLDDAAAIMPSNWAHRSRWRHRRGWSERHALRDDGGRKTPRISSKRRQQRAAVGKGLNPPMGRYRCLIPLGSGSRRLCKERFVRCMT
jgi:hypothetical protein